MRITFYALAAALLATVTLSACGSSSNGSSSGPSSTSAAARTPVATTPARPRSTDALTGFGATDSAWEAHHHADTEPGFTKGSAYDPDPALARGDDSRFDDRYYGVTRDGGRVIGYQMRFPPGTAVSEARRSALESEFPAGTHAEPLKTLDTCALLLVRSSAFRGITPHQEATVEFFSGAAGDTYDPDDVWGAIVTFGRPTEC